MMGWVIGKSWRGFVAFIGCMVTAGVAFAQDMPPTPELWAAAAPPSNTAAVPPATPSVPPAAPLPTEAQLQQLVAPIALYPDPLLTQILTASTYPLEVVEAARWVSVPANRALKGDAVANALQAQNWDPSVKSLVPFPQVLQNMSDQLQWTQDLGNAFLAQQADVMTAVQALRQQAMAAGNLKQTPQCRCAIKTSGNTISILPAEPQVACVPVYSPAVYGAWPYPAYPPYSFPAPVGFAYEPGFWIGYAPPIELAVFGPLWGWGWVDWEHRDIEVNPERYALVAGGHPGFSGNVWAHDPEHRGGVAYADPATRTRFDAARVSALTGAARSGAGRGETAHGGAGRFGAAMTGAGAGAVQREAASSGGTLFRARPGFHGGPHGAGGPHFATAGPHGGDAPHFAMTGPHGGGAPHSTMAGPHGGGAPHFAVGAPHGGSAPHFAMTGPHGGGGGPHGGGGAHGGGGPPGGGGAHGGDGPHGGGPGAHHG